MKNAVMLQGFEWYLPDDGEYYNTMITRVPDLAKAGFSAIWLPPFCKATGTGDTGYGIYDLYDLGEFDQKGSVRTKYGTKEQLHALIDTCHEHGILVYADVVMNHKAGADRSEVFKAVPVDPQQRSNDIGAARDIEGWTGFDFPGRKGRYSRFKWNFNHFTGVDFDQKTGENGIFRILGDNKGWAYGVSDELGNYDYLMFADVDHAHPDVKKELMKWSDWLVKQTKVDGFRLDALKHIDHDFVSDFIAHSHRVRGKDFYLFGEYWVADPDRAEHYLYETDYNMDIFDVGLHFNLARASKEGKKYDLRKIFDNSVVQEHPLIAVTFVDNHDTQPGQSLSSFVEPWFKRIAYGLILLRKDGYPCVFFGDYYGLHGKYSMKPQQEIIDNLLYIRKHYAHGEQIDYFDDPNTIGWVRLGTEEHPGSLAVVLTNGDMSQLTMNVGVDQAGKIYKDLTGQNRDRVTIDENGNGLFTVPPGSLTAWAEDLA